MCKDAVERSLNDDYPQIFDPDPELTAQFGPPTVLLGEGEVEILGEGEEPIEV
jgi:hypothetical protein